VTECNYLKYSFSGNKNLKSSWIRAMEILKVLDTPFNKISNLTGMPIGKLHPTPSNLSNRPVQNCLLPVRFLSTGSFVQPD